MFLNPRPSGLCRLITQYLFTRSQWRLWGLFAIVLAAYAFNIKLAVLYNDWNGRFFNALQAVNRDAIFRELFYFIGLAAVIIVLLVWAGYVKDRLALALRRAGKLFGEEKQAERIIRERTERLAALDDVRKSIRKGQKAAIFLAIRSPVRHESYVFRISERSALSQLLTNTFAIEKINVRPNAEERIPGIQELDDLSDLFEKNPDLIVYTGDAAACGQKTAEFIRKHPQFAECNAVKNGRIYGAPYYCHALDLRRHEILEAWSDVLAD